MASLFDKLYDKLTASGDKSTTNQKIEPPTTLDDDFICEFLPNHPDSKYNLDKELVIVGKDDNGNMEVYMGEWGRDLIKEEMTKEDPNIYVGWYDERGNIYPVNYTLSDLRTHAYLSGTTGAGKSTLLINFINQFARYNNNFAFLTPKEDDVLKLLQSLPEEELENTDIVRPGDTNLNKTSGYNLLDFPVPLDEINNLYKESDSDDEDSEFKQVTQLLEYKISTFSAVLTSEYGSGARIGPIISNTGAVMMISDKQYTLADFITIISDKEKFDTFVDDVSEEFGELPYTYLEKIQNYDEDDLAPVSNRFADFELSEGFRQMFFKKESDINFTDYVSGDRNIIFDMSLYNNNKNRIAFFGILFVRELWFAAQRRASRVEEPEREQIPVIIDEFQHIVTEENYDETQLGDILQQARQYRINLIAASQDPQQIYRGTWEEFKNNVNIMIPLKTKNNTSGLARHFNNTTSMEKIDGNSIKNLNQYESYNQPEEDGEIYKTYNFPVYPPYRTLSKARDIRDNIAERTGGEPVPRENPKNLSIVGDNDTNKEDSKNNEQKERMVCRSIDIAQRYYGYQNNMSEKAEYVPIELVGDILTEFGYDFAYKKLSNYVEKNYYLFTDKKGTDGYEIGLSKDGRKLAQKQDSGEAASGGGGDHRRLLRKVRKELAKHGVAVKIVLQDGDELPDAIGYKFRNVNNKAIDKLFNEAEPNITYIEVESTTESSKPSQTLKNLIGILKNGNKTVFTVDTEQAAERNEKRMFKNKGYSKIYDNGEKRLYNLGGELSIKSVTGLKKYPVRERNNTNKKSIWIKRNDKYVLKDSDHTEHAHLSLEELARNEWEIEQFPAYAYRTDRGHWVVKQDGDVKDKFDTKKDLKNSGKWMTIKQPLIPEYEFADIGYPQKNDLAHLVIEDKNKGGTGEIYIYEDGIKYYLDDTSEETSDEPDKDAHTTGKTTQKDTKQDETEEETTDDWKNRFSR